MSTQEKQMTNQEASSEKESFSDRFETEKQEWTVRIGDIASRFKNIEGLAEVQVDLYSQRQLATEYIHQMMVKQSQLKKFWLVEWKKVYDKFENSDVRYGEKERTKFADEATSKIKFKMEMIAHHIDFFRETVKTIDNMIFGVKHRVDIEDFKRGNR